MQTQRIKMDTMFMKSQNSKTPKPHPLKLKLTNQVDLKEYSGQYSVLI